MLLNSCMVEKRLSLAAMDDRLQDCTLIYNRRYNSFEDQSETTGSLSLQEGKNRDGGHCTDGNRPDNVRLPHKYLPLYGKVQTVKRGQCSLRQESRLTVLEDIMSQINCFNLESSYQYQRSKKKKKNAWHQHHCLVHPIGKLRQHVNQLV